MTEQVPAQSIHNPLTLVVKARDAQSWIGLREAVERLQSLPDEKNPVIIAR